MLRKTFQNIFRWIKAHSDMGKAIVLLRASKKENSDEKVAEAISLLNSSRSEFAELNREPAYAIATLSLADAFVGNSTGDKKKNIEQAIVLLDELLFNSIQNKNVDFELDLYTKIGRLNYELFLIDSSQVGPLDKLDRAIECLKTILRIAHPAFKREIWLETSLQLAAYFLVRYGRERNENLLKHSIKLLEDVSNNICAEDESKALGVINYLLGKAYSELTEANVGENSEMAIGYLCRALDSGFFSDMPEEKADIYLTLAESLIRGALGSVKLKSELMQRYAGKAEEILNQIDCPVGWERLNAIKKGDILIGISEPIPQLNFENIKNSAIETDLSAVIPFDRTNFRDWRKKRERFERELLNYTGVLLNLMIKTLENAPAEKRKQYIRQIMDYNFREIVRELKPFHPDLFNTIKKKIDEFQPLVQFVLESLNPEWQPVEWMAHHMSLAGTNIFRSSFEDEADEVERLQNKAIYHFKQALTILTTLKSSLYLGFVSRISGLPILFINRQWEGAEQLFRATLEIQEETYKLSLSEKGKEKVLKEIGNPLFGLSSAQAYVLARQGVKDKIIEAVEILEKWRGRRISEDLQEDPRNIKAAEACDYNEYCEIVDRIKALEAEQRDYIRRDFTTIVYELKSAREQLDNVIKRIRQTNPDFLVELSFADIRQAALKDTPLAYLLTTELGSLALLISREAEPVALWDDDFTKGELFSTISGSDWNSSIEELMRNHRRRLDSEILPSCSKLVGKLFDELERQKARGVVLIPCGTLAILPLHAVNVEGKGRLIDHFNVHFTPSANTILSARKNLVKDRKMVPRFIGIGDPDRSLKGAVPEVTAIAGFFRNIGKSELLIYEQATLENLHRNTQGVTHLHFACHGALGATDILDSCLKLANKEELTLRNLLNDRRFNFLKNTRIVVLSACWSSSIDLTKNSEESTGITLGFLSAGVPGVIGALWPVYDLSSTLLMVMFYRKHICGGLDPAASLRAAQCWLRDATWEQISEISGEYFDLPEALHKPNSREASYELENTVTDSRYPYADPYFWAGFILIGI